MTHSALVRCHTGLNICVSLSLKLVRTVDIILNAFGLLSLHFSSLTPPRAMSLEYLMARVASMRFLAGTKILLVRRRGIPSSLMNS